MTEGKVTGNAQLLLGYVTAAIKRAETDWPYRATFADPGQGSITVENHQTGTTFRVSVVQIGGDE